MTLFVPGGHGPMTDLLDDPDAGTVLRHFHKTSKPTAVLCHGPISLLAALPNASEVVGALKAVEPLERGQRLKIGYILDPMEELRPSRSRGDLRSESVL